MFWPYLNYTLGALGHCMQQSHTFLCCYYYFELNIRKPRLLPGQMWLDPNYSPVCMTRGWTFLHTLRWTNDAGEGVPSPTCNSYSHLRSQGSCHIPPTPPRFLFGKEDSGPDTSRNLPLQLFLLPLSILSFFLNTRSSSLLACEESSAFSGFSWDRYLWAGKWQWCCQCWAGMYEL